MKVPTLLAGPALSTKHLVPGSNLRFCPRPHPVHAPTHPCVSWLPHHLSCHSKSAGQCKAATTAPAPAPPASHSSNPDTLHLHHLLAQHLELSVPEAAKLATALLEPKGHTPTSSLSAPSPPVVLKDVEQNLGVLRSIFPRTAILRGVLTRAPALLTAQLQPWIEFLLHYGLTENHISHLLQRCPQCFLQGSVYHAGKILMFLRDIGLDTDDVIHRVLLEYPGILNLSVERDFMPRINSLASKGLDEPTIRAMIWEDPVLLCCSHDEFAYRESMAGV